MEESKQQKQNGSQDNNHKNNKNTIRRHSSQSDFSSTSHSSINESQLANSAQTSQATAPNHQHRMRPPFRPEPPKIPPPPSEHPPPYTPFGMQSQNAALLDSSTSRSQNQSANRRVVNPPGFRKYLHYLTVRNLLIAFGALIALVVFIVFVYHSNRADDEMLADKAVEEGHHPLRFTHSGLGAVKGNRDWIIFDEQNNEVILSAFDEDSQILQTDSLNLDEHLDGFTHRKFHLDRVQEHTEEGRELPKTVFRNCIRFTAQLFCCSTEEGGHERRHFTKCFLEQSNVPEKFHTSVASMFDFVPRWQSLVDGEALLLVHNPLKHALLDVKRNILHNVEAEHRASNFISHGFFFPHSTADELSELVRDGNEFRICEFVRTFEVDNAHGFYAPKDPYCRPTPFKYELELSQVLFCLNSLYSAVIQFDQLPDDAATLTWRLRLKFDDSSVVYSAGASAPSRQRQVALSCSDNKMDVFVLGDNELHKFSTNLPSLRNNERK